MSHALDRALGFRATKETRAMLHELAQRIFTVERMSDQVTANYTKTASFGNNNDSTMKLIRQHLENLIPICAARGKLPVKPGIYLECPTSSGGKFWNASADVVNEDYVRSRIDFRWQMFRVGVPPANTQLQDNLENDVRNLGCALYEEIARFATETWKNCYEGKTEVTRKALSPLKTIYDKLIGLSFVEPRVASIANLISTALGSIPQRGQITGATLLMLQGHVSLLRMPQEIVEHGQKILDGQPASPTSCFACSKQL